MMAFRAFFCAAFIGILFFCQTTVPASAQNNSSAVPSDQSSGLTVLISKISTSQDDINIQFIVKNNSNARVYLRDAQYDDSQKAFLGSGEQLSWPSVVGMEQCGATVDHCEFDPGYTPNDLSRYAYIEPGDRSSFLFTYQANSAVNSNDTISFSVALVARYATPGGDADQAGEVQTIRLNFPFIPLS